MARKKQSVGGGIVGILVLIALIPKEIWIGLGIAAVTGFAVWNWLRWRAAKKSRQPAPVLRAHLGRTHFPFRLQGNAGPRSFLPCCP